MDKYIKIFIEKYIQIIDSEQWDELLHYTAEPEVGLGVSACQELLQCLKTAGIQIPEHKRQLYFLAFVQETLNTFFDMPTYIHSNKSLEWFLLNFFENYYGYSLEEAAELVRKNSHLLGIYLDGEDEIIRIL